MTLVFDLPPGQVQRTALMAPFVKHEFEPVKNTRSARVAVSNAAALIAALLHCNDKMQDGDDFQRLSNLMYDPNRQLAKAASLLRKNGSDSENDTAVMILEYMVQATNKYYVGVAHAALVRKLRRDGMWDESGWPSEFPRHSGKA